LPQPARARAQIAYHRFVGYRALVDINLTEIGGSFEGKGQPLNDGAGWLLPQLVGLGRATEILMLGEAVPAARALEIGLVHRVVGDAAAARAEAQALAHKLASGPAFAHGMTKIMLSQEAHMSLPQALEAEAQAQQICMQTADFHEAYHAFIEKREPRFSGR
jgi:enoyl-CoA hydratase/carnithine racemase